MLDVMQQNMKWNLTYLHVHLTAFNPGSSNTKARTVFAVVLR